MSLIDELREEADLCRNEAKVDVANLLDKAADALDLCEMALREWDNEGLARQAKAAIAGTQVPNA